MVDSVPIPTNDPGSSGLPTDQQDAYNVMLQTLRDYGLESLAPKILQFIKEGHTQDQISVLMQSTDEYKQRFAGNEARRKAGLPVLSPKDYLSVESSYRQIMRSSGLPENFYDKPDDFAGWIGKDVSPSEIKTRVDYAVNAANGLTETSKQIWKDWYGAGPGDLAAVFLDQTRALPQIERMAYGAQLASQAAGTGLNLNREQAERYGGLLSGSNVSQQYLGQLGEQFVQASKQGNMLSSIYGDQYSMEDAAQDVLGNDVSARLKRKRLGSREQAEFSGSSGVGKGSLSSGNEAGSY